MENLVNKEPDENNFWRNRVVDKISTENDTPNNLTPKTPNTMHEKAVSFQEMIYQTFMLMKSTRIWIGLP